MKKKNIINLIRYCAEKNDVGFKNEAYKIAQEFDEAGDSQLSAYIMSLLSDTNTFVPQISEYQSPYFEKVSLKGDMLLLPDAITQDLLGIVNAIEHHIGMHKFLFQGAPGTGKTEAVKQLAKILKREIYMVNFTSVVDSKLGQTQKNLFNLFNEINNFPQPEKALVMFDEIDAIALDRTNRNDLREMGRAVSELLKLLDRMDENVVVIATTNLFDLFDKAIVRRFDSVIDFNRYTEEDLLEIAEKMLDSYLHKFKLANRDVRLFRKIFKLANPKPLPGDLKNIIKTSLAFSDPKDGVDYFRRLYVTIVNGKKVDLKVFKDQGFTIREIEILTKESKSSIARKLKGSVSMDA